MKPQNFYFDCETIANYELTDAWMARRPKPEFRPSFLDGPFPPDPLPSEQEWVDEQMKAMALQPEGCRLVGLNVILGEGDPKSGWVGEVNAKTGAAYTEEDLLIMFWQWAAGAARIIGYNCNRFDLHVIRVRSALLGVNPTMNLFNIKPWEDTVIDLLERRFKGVPTAQYLSLKALRRLLGFQVPEKYNEVLENTGGDIESLYLQFLAGDTDCLRVLKLYGELDVLTTRMLAQMFSGYYYQRIE